MLILLLFTKHVIFYYILKVCHSIRHSSKNFLLLCFIYRLSQIWAILIPKLGISFGNDSSSHLCLFWIFLESFIFKLQLILLIKKKGVFDLTFFQLFDWIFTFETIFVFEGKKKCNWYNGNSWQERINQPKHCC